MQPNLNLHHQQGKISHAVTITPGTMKHTMDSDASSKKQSTKSKDATTDNSKPAKHHQRRYGYQGY